MQSVYKFFVNLPKNMAIRAIEFYQFTFSPDHSWLKVKYPHGFCKHYPTCSEYSKQAIGKFGLMRGGWLAIKRVGKCNPWTESKIDLIPNYPK